MTNETRANRPAAPSQMVACAVVALAVLFVAVAVVGTLAAEDRPNGERPPQSVAQSSDSRDDVSATPPAHPTAGKRNGTLLPYCSFEVTVIEAPDCPWPLPKPINRATGVNDLGWVCGYYDDCDDPSRRHAYYWTAETGLVTINFPFPVHTSRANDISDTGLVVGDFRRPGDGWRGFVYDINAGKMIAELEPVDNQTFGPSCWANAVNNDGIVVGARSIGDTQQPYNAFIWTPGPPEEPSAGIYEDLGVMNGPNSSTTDVSETGHVTGWTGSGFGAANALGFVYRKGDIEFIEPVEKGYQSASFGINIVDEAAGRSTIETDQGTAPRPFHWIDGVTNNIGILPGDTSASARSINDENVIVGTSSNTDGFVTNRGAIWFDGEIYDFNDLLAQSDPALVIQRIQSISETGSVAGDGKEQDKNVGILLTPVERPLGDLTGDCAVGVDDLTFLLSEWGKTESPADLNGDGLVDGADLGMLLANWTTP